MNEIKIGDYVTAIYKTGKYAGEVTNSRNGQYLVRILAVLKHPMQGDLHHPKQVEVGFFHERRALAYREQAYIPEKMVKPYTEEMPDYLVSLKTAVAQFKETLPESPKEWREASLRCIENLEKDYFK